MIPQSCIDAEMASRVMQSLAVEGHNSIMPQYYDVVLTTKYIHERIHEIPADVTNPWLLHDTHIETHSRSPTFVGWMRRSRCGSLRILTGR